MATGPRQRRHIACWLATLYRISNDTERSYFYLFPSRWHFVPHYYWDDLLYSVLFIRRGKKKKFVMDKQDSDPHSSTRGVLLLSPSALFFLMRKKIGNWREPEISQQSLSNFLPSILGQTLGSLKACIAHIHVKILLPLRSLGRCALTSKSTYLLSILLLDVIPFTKSQKSHEKISS